MDKNKLTPPKKDLGNKTHDYLKDLIKIYTGGILNPLIDYILPSLHHKRYEEWCQNISDTLIELDNQKISSENLQDNLEFISILKESMIIASKNHQSEKLNMLKTGILNSLNKEISFDSKLIFIRLIDNLSLSHIIVLKIISENLNHFQNLNKFEDIYQTLLSFNNSLSFSESEFIFILNELDRNSLMKISREIEYNEDVREYPRALVSDGNSNLPFMILKEFGKQFLEFILSEYE